MTTGIKLGLADRNRRRLLGLSSIDMAVSFPTVLIDWLRDGPLAPLLLIGSMACTVVIPRSRFAAGSRRGCLRPVLWGLYAVIGAENRRHRLFLLAS